MIGKDKLISVEHLKWNVGGIKCGELSVEYLKWILDHEEPTVDAIPIEFIKARMEGYYKNSYTEFGSCLETLIEDWKKDNG